MTPARPVRPRRPAAAGIAFTLLVAAVALHPPLALEALEGRVYDVFLRAAPRPAPAATVVVVDIDEESLAAHGQWPWPRYRVAELVRRLRALGAAAVGLDVVFPEPDRASLARLAQEVERDLGIPVRLDGASPERTDNDRTLAAALAEGGTVLGYALTLEGERPSERCVLQPLPVFAPPGRGAAAALLEAPGVVCSLPLLARAAGRSGFFNVVRDADGTVRRIPVAARYAGETYPSFAVALIERAGLAGPAALQIDEEGHPALRLGERRVPLDARGNLLLRHAGGRGTHRSIPAATVLAGLVPAGGLAGRVAIVGTSAAGLRDLHATPFDAAVPGAEIQATAIDALLGARPLRRPPWAHGAELAGAVLLGLLGSLLFARLRARWGLPLLAGASAALWGGGFLLFAGGGVFVSPLAAQAALAGAFGLVVSLRYVQSEREAAEFARKLALTQDVIIQSMAALAETRDNETGGHIQRTRHYVKVLAERLREHPRFRATLDARTIEILFKLAPLHDIGKVGVRDHVLLKPARLTAEEFEEMKQHTVYGDDTLELAERNLGDDSFLRIAREFALTHQEKWDGTGYPNGLAGERIPVAGRLMAVADVYDALVSRRSYKEALPHAEAVRIIAAGRGTHFDPDVVDAFLGAAEQFRAIATRFADGSGALGGEARHRPDAGGA